MHDCEARFEGEPNSVSAARRFVAQTLESAGLPDQAWTAAQIISELATNAVLHAGTAFIVRVAVTGPLVRLAVIDERPHSHAVKRQFSAETTTGRGLRLVEQLSRAWGVASDSRTKTVWCEIVDAAVVDDTTDQAEDSRPIAVGPTMPTLPTPQADTGSAVPTRAGRFSMLRPRRVA